MLLNLFQAKFRFIFKTRYYITQIQCSYLLQESLRAEYVVCLNGLPLTPELDKLSKEGLLFTNLYCTGTRSVRGIEQVTAGFLPNPSGKYCKIKWFSTRFFTLADAFGRQNYDTQFYLWRNGF